MPRSQVWVHGKGIWFPVFSLTQPTHPVLQAATSVEEDWKRDRRCLKRFESLKHFSQLVPVANPKGGSGNSIFHGAG